MDIVKWVSDKNVIVNLHNGLIRLEIPLHTLSRSENNMKKVQNVNNFYNEKQTIKIST